MERTKKPEFKDSVVSKPESSFGSGTELWVKTNFAYNAQTLCLRMQSLIHWLFPAVQVPEMTWIQLTNMLVSSADISESCIAHPMAWYKGLCLLLKVQEEDRQADPETPLSHTCCLYEDVWGENHRQSYTRVCLGERYLIKCNGVKE